MHSFTTEDLLQYLYNETSPEQSSLIRTALINDWSLREKFDLLVASNQQLNQVKYSPRKQSIDNIMSYAEKAIEELSTQA